jgi:hypothetical protein
MWTYRTPVSDTAVGPPRTAGTSSVDGSTCKLLKAPVQHRCTVCSLARRYCLKTRVRQTLSSTTVGGCQDLTSVSVVAIRYLR